MLLIITSTGAMLFSGIKIDDISCIEQVQRSFTKRLPGLKNIAYRDRLAVTNLETLESRRLCANLVMCYKIIFRLINVDFHTFFRLALSNNTRGHRYKLFVEQSTHNVRYYFFSRRVVNVWNHLPFDTDFSFLTGFKAALKRTDLSKFLTYCTD